MQQLQIQPQSILVTGATGFIGRWLVRELTAQGHAVLALLRRPESQLEELARWVKEHDGDPARLEAVRGDLEQPGWGLAELDRQRLQQVDLIYHLASRFAWEMEPVVARRANVESLSTLLELADANPNLQRLVWVGGYMAGNPGLQHTLRQLEKGNWQAAYRRHGAYEASKLEGYVVLQQALAQRTIPWTFVHPSTVVGDSVSGEISQDIGLLKLVDALQKGRLTAVPGRRRDWLPLIPVDYLARFLAGVPSQSDEVGREYWVLDDGTPYLPELVRWLADGLGMPAPRMRIPVALLKWVLNAGLGRRWGMAAESLNFIDSARYDTRPALDLARRMGLQLPHTQGYVRNMVRYWADGNGIAIG
ncbi:MAG TPA: SDR family oxidoreductase [Dongiaceae bacterium]|nr:SDR family oxidoreductase [Dongiaceae bacterium]